MTSYTRTLDWMYAQLPMYQRKGAAAYRPGLDAVSLWDDYLGNPHKAYKTIHVGGTNGKGSTTHIMASILQTAGYKTGIYTSPHLLDFRERIKVNGKMISKAEVVDFIDQHKPYIENHQLSFFEMTVGMALTYFAMKEVDYAVIEVGLGGRLDATNIITPAVSVITNIALDHTQFLGTTRVAIAGEKAGIIKKGVPVVLGENDEETKPVFEKKAKEEEAPHVYALPYDEQWKTDLLGTYQRQNIATAVTALGQLQDNKITPLILQKGLTQVKKQTQLMGRWQEVGNTPKVVLDVGHNPAGIRVLVTHLKTLSYSHLHLVMGFVKERDVNAVLDLLPQTANFYFSTPLIDRGLSLTELKATLKKSPLHLSYFESLPLAFEEAKRKAEKKDLILVCGSTFAVSEILAHIKIIKDE